MMDAVTGRFAVQESLRWWLEPAIASERAANIAQALADGVADPERTCRQMLRGALVGQPPAAQDLCPWTAARAWVRASRAARRAA